MPHPLVWNYEPARIIKLLACHVVVEKVKYIRRNPVKRELLENPDDWECSSFHNYLSGADCGVEIESWRSRVP